MTNADESPLVKISVRESGIGLIELNRPKKRNALSQIMIDEIAASLHSLAQNPNIRAVVLTGCSSNGPFCAGVDLSELVNISTSEAHDRQFLVDLKEAFASFRKPIIAAVVGFALGGGFEIALACDMIYAAEDAKFGFPEIKIGTIPGAGGTQRLTRALGKQKAMEMILTGTTISGTDLAHYGLANKVFRAAEVLPKALELAETIASMSGPVSQLAKEAVLHSEQCPLNVGLEFEKALYYTSFSYNDCKEGMSAFLEKRPPRFRHKEVDGVI